MPSQKKSESKYAPTSWGAKASAGQDLTVPSGQTCRVRHPGVQQLITAGVLESMDSLSAIVDQKVLSKGKGAQAPTVDVKKLSMDGEQLAKVIEVADKVVVYMVLEPTILPLPAEGQEREEDAIYVDDVDLMDKMFLFTYASGGTRDLERFRSITESALVDVGNVKSVEDTTEPTAQAG